MTRREDTQAALCEAFVLARGPVFIADIAAHLGISHAAASSTAVLLCERRRPKVERYRADVPPRLRQAGKGAKNRQWCYAPRPPQPEPDAEKLAVRARQIVPPPLAPVFRPLQGSGLFGRPIVLRPGSDWALQRAPTVTMSVPGADSARRDEGQA